MRMAQAIGEEMSESEALALVNDAFFAEVFPHSAPTPDVSQDDLRKMLVDLLERDSQATPSLYSPDRSKLPSGEGRPRRVKRVPGQASVIGMFETGYITANPV